MDIEEDLTNAFSDAECDESDICDTEDDGADLSIDNNDAAVPNYVAENYFNKELVDENNRLLINRNNEASVHEVNISIIVC